MRLRLLIALGLLFALVATSAGLVFFYSSRASRELERIVEAQQIEALRQDLVMSILVVETDLFTTHTQDERRIESIVADVQAMKSAAAVCTSCHHKQNRQVQLERLSDLVGAYEQSLSYYFTASGSEERLKLLKEGTLEIAHELLSTSAAMSDKATHTLEVTTRRSEANVVRLRQWMALVLVLGVVVCGSLVLWLNRLISRPVTALLEATGRIRDGQLDHRLDYQDPTEFGELADRFNDMSASLQDNQQRRAQAEAMLRASNERFELTAEGTRDGLWDWDIAKISLEVSSRTWKMLGLREQRHDCPFDYWLSLVHEREVETVRNRLRQHLESDASIFRMEHRMRHSQGHYRCILSRAVTVRDDSGRALRMVGSVTDITEQVDIERQLRHRSLHDPLTGLPNRALLMDRLKHAAARAQRHKSNQFAVLYVDLNRFKIINDTLGHRVGDQVLVQFADRLRAFVRPEDTVARFGGDEFVLILSGLQDERGAVQVAQRISNLVNQPFEVDGKSLTFTASIGIATSSTDFSQPSDLLRYADVAMYQAKTEGAGRIQIFDQELHRRTMGLMELERDLRTGFNRSEFRVYYQPIVNLAESRVAGFEALLRWEHPEQGILLPGKFLSLAEENGLIVPVGLWLCEQAFRQIKLWNQRYGGTPEIFVAINLSGRQLMEHDLVESIENLLVRTEVDPRLVKFELTETALMKNAELAAQKLTQLHELGFQLCLDDFGTGYSSLSYLQLLPFNNLKIDRSFLSEGEEDRTSAEILEVIVDLARRLRMTVTAEGVEMGAQLQRVRRLACDFAQGYLISHPLDVEGACEFLSQIRWQPELANAAWAEPDARSAGSSATSPTPLPGSSARG